MKLKYLAIIVMVALLVLAVGCSKKAAPAPEPVAPPPAPAPAPAPAPVAPVEEAPAEEEYEEVVLEEGGDVTMVAEEEKESEGLATDLTTASTAFPQAACELKEVDGEEVREITVKIMNVEDEEWVIYGKVNPKGKVRIGNRGPIDIEPGCEEMTLQPGQSTLCTGIDNGAVIEGENRVTVNTPGQQYARVVMCP